jgi:hypothetical protein
VKNALVFVCSLLLFIAVIYGAIGYQIRRTVFSSEFSRTQVERADPVRIVKSMLIERLDAPTASALTPVIDKTLNDQRAWLTAEIGQAATSIQYYLRGDEGRIQVHIDPEPVRTTFLTNMEDTIRTSLPPEVARLSDTERLAFESAARQAANSVFDQIGSFTFDSERLPPERQSQLLMLRSRLAMFQQPLILVVCAIVALAAIAGALGGMRQAAVAILLAGVVVIMPAIFARSLVGLLPLPSLDRVPGVVAAYLPTFMESLMGPLRPIAIACLVVAFGMLMLSFVLPRQAATPSPVRR